LANNSSATCKSRDGDIDWDLNMLDALLGLGLGFSLLAYIFSPDEELDCIKKAAQGEQVDIHKLASAYWNKYSATHIPKSKWLKMYRHEKSEVLAKREEFERFYANFEPSVQNKVQSVRPRDFSAPRSSRIEEKFAQADVPLGETIGIVLSAEGPYGFVRPIRSMTSYFFHSSDVWGGCNLVTGDIARFVLSENPKGLCAKSLRKHLIE
jgi:hypothetical protein